MPVVLRIGGPLQIVRSVVAFVPVLVVDGASSFWPRPKESLGNKSMDAHLASRRQVDGWVALLGLWVEHSFVTDESSAVLVGDPMRQFLHSSKRRNLERWFSRNQ